jgi:hypothetical protein
MTPEYYQKIKADPVRWAEHLRKSREWGARNKEKKNLRNREYGKKYRKLIREYDAQQKRKDGVQCPDQHTSL